MVPVQYAVLEDTSIDMFHMKDFYAQNHNKLKWLHRSTFPFANSLLLEYE